MKTASNIFNIIIIGFLFLSCDKDEKQWTICKRNGSFKDFFSFAYSNRDSKYLDSAVLLMNKELIEDKSFYLRFYEDSITYNRQHNDYACIRKSNLLLYNTTKNEILYYDTLTANMDSIKSKLKLFIAGGNRHWVYMYNDTLSTKSNWIDLFVKIDYVLEVYRFFKTDYSLKHYNQEYLDLDTTNKKIVKDIIPINLVLYFHNPFPPTPQFEKYNFTEPVVFE